MIIERFHSNYIVENTNNEDAVIAQHRLDRIATDLLDNEIDSALSRVLSDDCSLCFIERVDVDLSLNLARLNDRDIANLWAKKIASEIVKMLQSVHTSHPEPYRGSNVAIFHSRAEYLAHFIHDLLMGIAWDKWYYQGFHDLSTISRKEVIKLVFKQNQEIAEEIFAFLVDIGAFNETLEELTEEDISLIYSQYLGEKLTESFSPHMKAESQYYRHVNQVVSDITRNDLFSHFTALPQSYKSCLKVYVLFRKKHPDFESKTSLKLAIKDIVFEKLTPPLLTKTKKIEIADTSEKMTTPYGGLFLLIHSILEIKLNDLINQSRFPEEGNISRLNYFLLFLASKITNQKIPNQTNNIDPGLILFAGLKATVSNKNLGRYSESIIFSMNEEFLKSLINAMHTLKEQRAYCMDHINLKHYLDISKNIIVYEKVISLCAELILKAFSGRLMGFEESSPAYIFNNFLHRPSEIILNRDNIHIKLSSKPLDVVLRLSHMLESISGVPWLDNRSIEFELEH